MSFRCTPAVVVVIEKDADLVNAFLSWTLDNQIFSLRHGGGFTGQGYHTSVYAAEHGPAITAFVKDYRKRKRHHAGS